MFIKTYKESPNDAEVISHKLMARASMVKKLASGVYTYLPMGYKVLRKVENIVREEMNRAGAQEVLMPVLQPAELWQESGRWNVMGDELMRLKDRHSREFCLGPTHEEVITDIIRNEVSSYKQLPMNIYQIQTKFRDERRPRFGLMRGREFLMKDGYSFHLSEESLDEEYNNMKNAYRNVFDRMGLDYRPVEADGGAIGDSQTEEFHVLAESGEDDILFCNTCSYAANSEKAVSGITFVKSEENQKEMELIDTPGASSIEDLAKFLNIEESQTVKAMLYKEVFGEETKYIMALIRGDYEVNEVKLANTAGARIELELAEEEDFKKLSLVKGYMGPVGVKNENLIIVIDESVLSVANSTVGANVEGKHYINVNIDRDYKADIIGDIRMVQASENCPKCSGKLDIARGIEVGQVFKLGKKYSEALNAKVLDQNGKEQHMTMGCYGIGVSRTAAAAVEQNYDEFGIIWPRAIAPFEVDVIPANIKDEAQMEGAEKIYSELLKKSVDVCIDDRNERAGFKFKDADLIGFPLKVIVGKGIAEGKVEVKIRRSGEAFEVEVEKAVEFVLELLEKIN
jgi:prolyl-tRNA synthetase